MMIGRKATICLSLLSALMFCALAAPGASTAEASNTTAVTCVKGGGLLDFKDPHCDETTTAGKGEFGHVAIANGIETEIHLTNEKTAEKTTKSTPLITKGTVFGMTLEIECTTVETDPNNTSFIRNKSEGLEHSVDGTVAITFNNCTYKKPTNCITKPITIAGKFTGIGGNEMGLAFKPDGGELFAEFTVEDNGTGKCALKNILIQVVPVGEESLIVATGTPPATAKESGATLNFSPANGMQNLEIRGTKKPFTLETSLTWNMVNAKGETENPISLTTTT